MWHILIINGCLLQPCTISVLLPLTYKEEQRPMCPKHRPAILLVGLQLLRLVSHSSALARTDPNGLLWWPDSSSGRTLDWDVLWYLVTVGRFMGPILCYKDMLYFQKFVAWCLSFLRAPTFSPFLLGSSYIVSSLGKGGLLCWTLPQSLACMGKICRTIRGVILIYLSH